MPEAGPVTSQAKRSRTGCFTCRRRRKKCDETKPSCLGCQRSGYICEGYPLITRYQASRARQSKSPPNPFNDGSIPSPISTLDPAANSQVMPYTLMNMMDWLPVNEVTSAMPEYLLNAEPLDTYQDPPSKSPTPEEPSRMPAENEDIGSIECRPATTSEPRRRAQIPRTLPFLINGVDTATDRLFFMHFVNVTSRVLTICMDDQNPLLTTILPRSLQDSMIQKAILLLGSSNLQKLSPDSSPWNILDKEKLLQETENAQVDRISFLRSQDVQFNRIEMESVLCCTLLLCLYEISEGTGDVAWRVRLDVAKELIWNTLSLQRPPGSPQIDDFLLEFFIYHDILAAVTDEARTPTLATQTVTCLSSEPLSRPYMIGVDDGLFDLIARVAALRSNKCPTPDICTALAIWEDLNDWKPSTEDCDKKLGYSAYLHALYIWIYSIMYPSNISDEKVRAATRAGLEDMDGITNSGVQAVLLFPAFVFGFACIRQEERQICSTQFEKLSKFSGMGNVKLAYDLVQSSWAEYDNGMQNTWDWVDHMARHGISLPVT